MITTFRRLTIMVVMSGVICIQQTKAAELYTNDMAGPIVLPVNTYGSIKITKELTGTKFTSALSLNYSNVSGVIESSSNIVSHTIGFWFQTPTLTDTDIYSAKNFSTYEGARGYALRLKTDGNLQVYIANAGLGSGYATYTTTSAPIKINRWMHVAIAIKKDESANLCAEFFINGISIGSGTDSTHLTNLIFHNSASNKVARSLLNGGQLTELNFHSGFTFSSIFVDDVALDVRMVRKKALTISEPSSLDTDKVFTANANLIVKGLIRGSIPGRTKIKEVITGNEKLRWYDKNDYFTLLKCRNHESFLIVSFQLQPSYSLSKHDYFFKSKSTTYPCLSVSSGRGFGVKLSEVKAEKRNLPVRMIFKINKGDSVGSLIFNLGATVPVPAVTIITSK